MKYRENPQMPFLPGTGFSRTTGCARKARRTALLLVGISLLSFACYYASGKSSSAVSLTATEGQDTDPCQPEAVRGFIRLARTGKIDAIFLRYECWEVESSNRTSERDLMGHAPSCEVVMRGRMAKSPVRRVAEAFAECKLTSKDMALSELDFALGVAFCADGSEVLRLCISKYPPALSVNGELFEAVPRLVYPLRLLLPAEAYDGMFFYTLDEWAYPPYKETIGGFRRKGPKDEDVDLDMLVDRIKRGEAVRKER